MHGLCDTGAAILLPTSPPSPPSFTTSSINFDICSASHISHLYIYIYIYIVRQREIDRERERQKEGTVYLLSIFIKFPHFDTFSVIPTLFFNFFLVLLLRFELRTTWAIIHSNELYLHYDIYIYMFAYFCLTN